MRLNENLDLKDLTLPELQSALEAEGEPKYRAGQIFEWVYKRGAISFDAFTDLPKGLRQTLGDRFSLLLPELAEHRVSEDRAEKFLFRLPDGNFVETVLIPAGVRQTLCLSSQVGCRFGCGFCASGMGGFQRQLRPSEIVGQVLYLRDRLKIPLTNFVFMGMGEPLDNFDNLAKAILIMNAPEGLGIAARRITVSTAGVIPGIERLKKMKLQVNLSLSLHAVNDELRSKLMPINRKYPLAGVLRACQDYVRAGGRVMTVEYILLRGLNDSVADARRLGALAARLKAKVNLIPYSEVCGPGYEPSLPGQRELFLRKLEKMNVRATLRRSRGADIQAACGQLAGRKPDDC
jgi:23S rRNA (adenine2503-C2)-methyltransferase